MSSSSTTHNNAQLDASPSETKAAAADTDGPTQPSSKTDNAAKSEIEPESSRLPSWITDNVKDPRSLKMLCRCWLASWAAFVLILPQRSLETLGQAAFFSSLLTFMIPSSMPISIFLLANFTLVLGCCLGWAWSAAAMAAAIKARDLVVLQSRLRIAQSSIAGSTNPEAEYQAIIFEGFFLDTNSTAVFGVFFMIGCYAFAILQVKVPKLKIAGIFGTIILDIMCSYGPLFPFAQYTLATIFLIPIGCSLAIATACQILIFPETLSYAWQNSYVKLIRTSRSLLQLHTQSLAKMADLSEDEQAAADVSRQTAPKVKGLQSALIALAEGLGGQAGFLELEITYSRLGAKDLISVLALTRSMGIKLFGLASFLHLLDGKDEDYTQQGVTKDGDDYDFDEKHHLKPVRIHETHSIVRLKQKLRKAETEQHVELSALLPILKQASSRPLECASSSLEHIANWFDETCRRKKSYDHEKSVEALRKCKVDLEDSLKAFVEDERMKLIEPYLKNLGKDDERFISPEAIKQFRAGARPLFICLVFAANLNNMLSELIKLNDHVLRLAEKRTSNRIWFPTGLRKIGKILVSKRTHTGSIMRSGQDLDPSQTYPEDASQDGQSTTSDGHMDGHGVDDLELSVSDEPFDGGRSQQGGNSLEENKESSPSVLESQQRASSSRKAPKRERHYRRDPDALPPTRLVHNFGRSLSNAYSFISSADGVFALKYCIASFAVWIVAVIPSSAGFNYHQRGVWALIMAQTGLAVYGGELIYSVITRLAGTVLGGVVGMLIWYISTGNGNGNPYGLAASAAVFFVPLVFLRIFAPMALLMPVMMTAVTTVLVAGYSWIDANLPVSANSGIGYAIAWRRALLVIIGMAVAFIVMIFPRPQSTRRMVRETFSKNTAEISKLYSIVIEGWIVVESSERREKADAAEENERANRRTEKALTAFRTRFIDCQARLGYLNSQINLASLDFPLRGRWPKERYEEMLSCQARMLESLAQLAAALQTLDMKWRRKMLHNTAILDPLTIGDVSMTLAYLGQSLRTASPLPHASGSLLERTLHNQGLARSVNQALNKRLYGQEEELVTPAMLKEPMFMKHVAGSMGLISFVTQLDKFREIVKDLIGEVPLPGFDELRNAYDDRLVAAHLDKA